MRMWHKSLTKHLCNKHLNGAHNELHKFKPTFTKKHSIIGRIFPVVQIEPWRMKEYHDELAAEMVSRGMNHQSPYEMPDISYLSNYEQNVCVDIDISRRDLASRCIECALRMGVKLTEYQIVKLEGRL